MANKKGSRQLRWEDRVRIEALLSAGVSVPEIARRLGKHYSTIYRELQRGRYTHLNSDYTEEERYAPEIAQSKADEGLSVRGTQLKIGKDMKFARYLEDKILNEGYSPAAVLGELKAQGRENDFETNICTATLYSYINKGVFLNLTNKQLPEKGKRKRTYNRIERRRKRPCPGDTIDDRPEEAISRQEFGHWEMDTVHGKKGTKSALLVLTERKSREELVFKLPDHAAASVVSALDGLEQKWGPEKFGKVFRTITVDNGTEFADVTGIERSSFGDDKRRTKVYYTHPYSSWERGSNEAANRMIRRRIPKKTNFDGKTDREIAEIEHWINTYPRRIHGYHSAHEIFEQEIAKLA